MFAAERHRKMAEVVNGNGSCSIQELARMFGVSEMTVHRDLRVLERIGLLQRMRGGALAADQAINPMDYQGRIRALRAEKEAIGRAAARFVQEGDVLIIEASTTCLAAAREVRNIPGVSIYTNSPLIMMEAPRMPKVEIYCVGGMLSKRSMAIVGPPAEAELSRVRADKCFLGAHGFTLEDGVTDPFLLEASEKRRMVESSQEVYVLLTHDKFGHMSSQVSVPLEAIDVVITDAGLEPRYRDGLEERGIRCIIAGKEGPEGPPEDTAGG